jgi:hypothetical protein
MLQAGEQDAAGLLVHVSLHFDDRRHGFVGTPEELQADGTHMRRHAVQDEGGLGDQAVAAFLLHARQTAEKLVGDVLAQAFLAKQGAGQFEHLRGTLRVLPSGWLRRNAKGTVSTSWILPRL